MTVAEHLLTVSDHILSTILSSPVYNSSQAVSFFEESIHAIMILLS